MKTIEERLVNFRYLVKNRLGPYKIVVKRNDNGMYWSQPDNKWNADKSLAHDYGYNPGSTIIWSSYLMTAAGDIQLSIKDFK
jgi:hypothetical protein